MSLLLDCTELSPPVDDLPTFPSWRPNRNIDHVLVSPSIRINDVKVLQHTVSDHLPIAVDVTIPAEVVLESHRTQRQLTGS
jgi:endonuclease/exonuclease/phosphatase family metal-dependent hydrolase